MADIVLVEGDNELNVELTTYTDASGNYGFEGLIPGSYVIKFSKEGYETATY